MNIPDWYPWIILTGIACIIGALVSIGGMLEKAVSKLRDIYTLLEKIDSKVDDNQ